MGFVRLSVSINLLLQQIQTHILHIHIRIIEHFYTKDTYMFVQPIKCTVSLVHTAITHVHISVYIL